MAEWKVEHSSKETRVKCALRSEPSDTKDIWDKFAWRVVEGLPSTVKILSPVPSNRGWGGLGKINLLRENWLIKIFRTWGGGSNPKCLSPSLMAWVQTPGPHGGRKEAEATQSQLSSEFCVHICVRTRVCMHIHARTYICMCVYI